MQPILICKDNFDSLAIEAGFFNLELARGPLLRESFSMGF